METKPKPSFSQFAYWIARQSGRTPAFALALLCVIVWAVTGPLFHWSDTWQLVINTGTTIVTFLMVFLIQNTQNRDTDALQVKLDELIRTNRLARNSLINLEQQSEAEIDAMKRGMAELSQGAEPAKEKRASRR